MKSKEIGYLVIALIVFYGITRITGVVQFYNNETPSMEPAIKTGSMIFASNLKSPERYSIVAFDVNPYLENNRFNKPSEESTHISRIVAMENEEIKIENGTIYINKKKIEPPYELLFTYKMKYDQYEQLKNEHNLILMNPLQSIGEFAYVYMNSVAANKIKNICEIEKFDSPINGGNLYKISEVVESGWTTNNFGPGVM